MKKYIIAGNGVAGITAAEHVRNQDQDGRIIVITDEKLPFYFRTRLNDLISQDITEKALIAKKDQWYKDRQIEVRLDTRIIDADPGKKTVTTENNETISYDSLLLSTGSHSFIPPIKGSDSSGVFALRSVQDVRNIMAWVKNIKNVVLIGGGLLGLEAGNALRKLGKKIMVVEFFPRLLPRQLDVEGANRLQNIMEGMGFDFRLGAKTEEIFGDDQVRGVRLEGGETLSANMVIISAGVRPNMELADALGLDKDKGIKVDERLRTSRPDIYAAGDVAEFQGMPYGIWPAAMEQGKIAGTNMAGGDMVYKGTTIANTLKVVGIDLASAGNIDAENQLESRVLSEENLYKKIVIENDVIAGCIMLGDIKGFNKITKAMADKTKISQLEDKIISLKF